MSKSPIKTFKSGLIAVSVWKNEGEHGPFPTITLDRRYREDGETKYTKSLTKDSLLHAIKALGLADRFTDGWDKRKAERAADGAEQPTATEAIPEKDAAQTQESPDAEGGDSDELDSYL